MDTMLLDVCVMCNSGPKIRSGVKMTPVNKKANLYSSDSVDVFITCSGYAFGDY